jgi:hypothetical protein
MSNFLLAYHGGKMPASPEEQREVMAAWNDWYGELGEAIIDGGNPVGATMTVASSGSVSAGGGANPVSGYTLISADSMDAALAMARGCPVLMGGASVEVCETFDFM